MIAISYRREDSLPIAGRLYDRLEAKFGKQNVFMDFDSIRPGFDFREQIKETIARSKVVLAVIGPNWFGEKPDGTRRIDDRNDFVRLEIEYALKRGIPIIPVLVNDTPMPNPETLPSNIQGLAFRHGLPLDSGLDFRQHADRLIAGLSEFAQTRTLERARHLAKPDKDFDFAARAGNKRYAIIFGFVVATGLAVAWLLNINSKSAPRPELVQSVIDHREAVSTPVETNAPAIVERIPATRESTPRTRVTETERVVEQQPLPPRERVPTVTPLQVIVVPPQNLDAFTGTWQGSYVVESMVADGSPSRGPFPIQIVISSNHQVSKSPPSECAKWVGSGPGILACFGRHLETLTLDEGGETASYFMQGDDVNLNGTLRKAR